MNFAEKLIKLTEGRSRAQLAREAGLPANAISDYINKGSWPRLDNAASLAKVLGVSLDWLADDEADCPPPDSAASLTSADDNELTRELGRRMMLSAGGLLANKCEEIYDTDWFDVTRQLLECDPQGELPQFLREKVELPGQIMALASELRCRFNPHGELGQAVPVDRRGPYYDPRVHLSLLELWDWHLSAQDRPGYALAAEIAAMWTVPKRYRIQWYKDNVQEAKKSLATQAASVPAQQAVGWHVSGHRITMDNALHAINAQLHNDPASLIKQNRRPRKGRK